MYIYYFLYLNYIKQVFYLELTDLKYYTMHVISSLQLYL